MPTNQHPQIHEIRQCTADDCRLRFPMPQGERPGERCPVCGAPTLITATITNDAEATPRLPARQTARPPLWPIAVLLDNIRSLFNVGSIFRSADGAGVAHLYLCGITPTPANPKLTKTALGAETAIPWSHHNNSLDTIQELCNQDYALWALEEHPAATSLFITPLPERPLLLIIGNEITGVDPALLARADQIVALPMRGTKRSLNVATAFGAAAVVLAERRYGAVG